MAATTLSLSTLIFILGIVVSQVESMPPWKSEVTGSDNVLVSPHKADCETKHDGYYPDYESGCRSYYFCSGGLKATYVCANGGVFDGTRCVSTSQYQCPFMSRGQHDCVGLSAGYYHDLSTQCRNYFFCLSGFKMITLTCSAGRLFDGKKCVDPESYLCPLTTREEPYSPNKLPLSYSSLTLMTNPSHTQARVGGGSISNQQEQQATQSQSTQEEAEKEENVTYSIQCETKYGFFVDKGSGCKSYHFCINGVRTNLTCNRDMVFNGQVCVDKQFYHCPESGSDFADQLLSGSVDEPSANISEADIGEDCRNKSDGVYVNRTSGCKSYFLCNAGRQVSFNCPDGTLFDGHRCLQASEVVCSPIARTKSERNDEICSGLSDGFYADVKKGDCQSYVHCKEERNVGAGSCSDGLHFSSTAQQCTPESKSSCRNESVSSTVVGLTLVV